MIYTQNDNYTLYQGDMTKVLDELPENSVGSIVTDPPYEIGFMGKSWDSSGIAFQKSTWEKCFRVLKPGGYLLSFGGCRTFHRIACAIEDAGFEIRDTIMYMFGTGFPKSMNISKAIDAKTKFGNASTVSKRKIEQSCDTESYTIKQPNNGILGEIREVTRKQFEPSTDLAKKWDGYGTQLKPAYEPVIVARKPVEGNITENVMKYGVGAINIDECRIEYEKGGDASSERTGFSSSNNEICDNGRFPSNLILSYDDETYDEVCSGFPDSDGCKPHKIYSNTEKYEGYGSITKKSGEMVGYPDNGGSASRYFYCAKASSKDRDEGLDYFEKKTSGELTERKEGSAGITAFTGSRCPKSNNHPTVKPTNLLQYLVRLVTPKGETVLDPFMGSGSTGKAVMFENRERNADYKFIGVELTEEYLPICHARIEWARDRYKYEVVEDEEGNKSEMKKEELF